jgi:hypothetical protein
MILLLFHLFLLTATALRIISRPCQNRIANRVLVSMADLIAKVSRTTTNWKDPGLSRTQDTSHFASGRHDHPPPAHPSAKTPNLKKSYHASISCSDVQLDDITYSKESELSRTSGLEINVSRETRVYAERRKSLGASTNERSDLELGEVVSIMGE